ncbi:MAG: glycosyl hydrolase 53 family protein [Prevotellaceae bacterium]|nr:glycosyl hydrolase 53 family protein [Prevotellaceae bacterium]
MRQSLVYILLFGCLNLTAQSIDFARGADISWCSEMEAAGMRFYNFNGQETDIFLLMKQIGMNAIRLRVWVNPETGYGAWSDKADVLAKAQRAKQHGLSLMIDFHYSDYFADPGRQTKPSAWSGFSFEDTKTALGNHTKDVLQALKAEGIEPLWVQVGNETASGMVWEDGRIDWNLPESERWLNYVALSNAGYDAVKQVLPKTSVIVHHDNAIHDNVWFYEAFKKYGGKFDMIGLSHYPDWETWSISNTTAASNLRKLHDAFAVPVMIVETGYSTWDEKRAERVMKDLLSKMEQEEGCAGVLYWEPEVYGGWEARQLLDDGTWKEGNKGQYGVKVTNHGAFNEYGQPSAALLAFGVTTGIERTVLDNVDTECYFNLQGQRVSKNAKGIKIVHDGISYRKVMYNY